MLFWYWKLKKKSDKLEEVEKRIVKFVVGDHSPFDPSTNKINLEYGKYNIKFGGSSGMTIDVPKGQEIETGSN